MSKRKKRKLKLDEFLQKYKTKEGEESTHLRIPDPNCGVYGGKWCIKGKKALKEFCNIYHHLLNNQFRSMFVEQFYIP